MNSDEMGTPTEGSPEAPPVGTWVEAQPGSLDPLLPIEDPPAVRPRLRKLALATAAALVSLAINVVSSVANIRGMHRNHVERQQLLTVSESVIRLEDVVAKFIPTEAEMKFKLDAGMGMDDPVYQIYSTMPWRWPACPDGYRVLSLDCHCHQLPPKRDDHCNDSNRMN